MAAALAGPRAAAQARPAPSSEAVEPGRGCPPGSPGAAPPPAPSRPACPSRCPSSGMSAGGNSDGCGQSVPQTQRSGAAAIMARAMRRDVGIGMRRPRSGSRRASPNGSAAPQQPDHGGEGGVSTPPSLGLDAAHVVDHHGARAGGPARSPAPGSPRHGRSSCRCQPSGAIFATSASSCSSGVPLPETALKRTPRAPRRSISRSARGIDGVVHHDHGAGAVPADRLRRRRASRHCRCRRCWAARSRCGRGRGRQHLPYMAMRGLGRRVAAARRERVAVVGPEDVHVAVDAARRRCPGGAAVTARGPGQGRVMGGLLSCAESVTRRREQTNPPRRTAGGDNPPCEERTCGGGTHLPRGGWQHAQVADKSPPPPLARAPSEAGRAACGQIPPARPDGPRAYRPARADLRAAPEATTRPPRCTLADAPPRSLGRLSRGTRWKGSCAARREVAETRYATGTAPQGSRNKFLVLFPHATIPSRVSRVACAAFTAPSGSRPAASASTWRTVSIAWCSAASGVSPPICGVATTSGRRRGAGGPLVGRHADIHRRAAELPASSAASSAASSTNCPRERFTKKRAAPHRGQAPRRRTGAASRRR